MAPHRHSAKRARASTGGAYHDSVPLDNNEDAYDHVHIREETLQPRGYTLRTSTVESDLHRVDAAWFRRDTWGPPDDLDFCLDDNGDLYNDLVEADVMNVELHPPDSSPTKRMRSELSRRPHVVWKRLHRDLYLDELLRWSGRADFHRVDQCLDCVARKVDEPGRPAYRCMECLQPDLVCQSCCVLRHMYHPLHWIEQWTGSAFVRVSLRSLGLKVQLNHAGMRCSNPVPCHANLRILHVNGIHDVAVNYCGCERAVPQHIQMLRRRFYPASHLNVQTAASFKLLRILHLYILSTNGSVYDFYGAIDKLTANMGIATAKSRYRALMRMLLQWRHLKMLMRAGRGHDSTGAGGTKPGELAVPCPSCPRPGINLPEGWENAPPNMRYLYAMILCMDANFRLKNNLVSNYSQDPGLGNGLAYMVPRVEYEKYVLSRANEQDISTCVGFQALAKANTKNSAGLRYTGVNMVVCGRSEMVMPLSVGNLQKGERYCNMDYVMGSVLQALQVLAVIVSYDICCQWYTNLFKRIEEHWPNHIKPSNDLEIKPAIPKLHEPMHHVANHQVYSFNYILGGGLTDGECIERIWAILNALANMTKVQGPGSRQDVLDDHMGFVNWLKYVALGITLLRRYKAAVAERNVQVEAHRGLSASLETRTIERWSRMCENWEAAPHPKKVKNPYATDEVMLSEDAVRKKLDEDEERRVSNGGIVLHATSASTFLAMGLELEEAQRRLTRLAKKTPEIATAHQDATITQQRAQLLARIQAWEQLSPIYMPGLLQYQYDNREDSSLIPRSNNPEDHILWLPSRVGQASRSRVCSPNLAAMEDQLRIAQCRDAIQNLRRILTIKTRMIAFKNKNLRGQRDGTRSRAVIDRVHERAQNCVAKYRAARSAKLELVGAGDWEQELRILNDGDVRGYQDPDRLRIRLPRRGIFEDGHNPNETLSGGDDSDEEPLDVSLVVEDRTRRVNTGETRRTLSWIWLSQTPSSIDQSDDILRTEWAKSRARSQRATEEVELLKEEMRRVLEFLPWKSRWWKGRVAHGRIVDSPLDEGLASYAHTQSAVQQTLEARFRKLWESPLGLLPLDLEEEEDLEGEGDDDDDDNVHDETHNPEHGEDESERGNHMDTRTS